MIPPAGGVRTGGIPFAERRFIVVTACAALLAHAACYLLHEYAHSVRAFLLGWKREPLLLSFGPPTLANLLFQQEIEENVDYDAIFAAHGDAAAALIALAGPGIGNGLAYGLFFTLFRRRIARRPDAASVLLFWLATFSAGNVWSYAPTRTISTHGDMALLARGLHLSPWTLLPLVTVPALLLLLHAFRVMFPLFRTAVLDPSPVRLLFASALFGWTWFGFFGGLDLSGHYGPVPALLSVLSVLLLLSLSVTWCVCATPPVPLPVVSVPGRQRPRPAPSSPP